MLLQEVDDWPSTSLLIAATNHGELLDPAVWRRFDDVLTFSAPSARERAELLQNQFCDDDGSLADWMPLLVALWEGRSFSDITRGVQWIRRRATITNTSVFDVLLDRVGRDLRAGSAPDRKRAAGLLAKVGYSDRQISEAVGISRDTIRKSRRVPAEKDGAMNNG